MAKKSARSKGYRKQSVKKPYLSKRDIILLCVLALAICIAAFFLFRYDDGALKVKDGVVLAETESDLIVNGSSSRNARYYKLGEIGEVEGLAREKTSALTDANLPQYVFTDPGAADGGIRVTVACSHNRARTLAERTQSTMASLTGIAELGGLKTADLAGSTFDYYLYTTSAEANTTQAEEAPESGETAETNEAATGEAEAAAQVERCAAAYTDASHDSCVVLRAEAAADTAEALPSEEALLDAIERVAAAVTLAEADE